MGAAIGFQQKRVRSGAAELRGMFSGHAPKLTMTQTGCRVCVTAAVRQPPTHLSQSLTPNTSSLSAAACRATSAASSAGRSLHRPVPASAACSEFT